MKKALVTCHVGRHYKKFGHYDIFPLLEMGYEVHFASNFSLDVDKVDNSKIILHQIDFSRNPFSLKNIIAYFELRRIINEYDFDLIHCQSPVGGVITRLAAKKTRKKGTRVIYTAHGFHFYKGAPKLNWFLFYPIERYLSKYTDILITINKEDYDLANRKFKKCNDVEYIPGIGIDEKKFNFKMTKREKIDLRKSLGLKNDDFVMIYPARIDKNKNQKFLINVMEVLTNEYDNIHLLIVGKDELKGYCQKLVNEKKLQKNVHFLGYRNDVPQLLKISDLSVSASLREGLPVNVIEALYCNLPVVALKCRGMEDLIQDEKFGYLIEKFQDSNKYINSIKKIIEKKEKNENCFKTKGYIDKYMNKSINKIFKKICRRKIGSEQNAKSSSFIN